MFLPQQLLQAAATPVSSSCLTCIITSLCNSQAAGACVRPQQLLQAGRQPAGRRRRRVALRAAGPQHGESNQLLFCNCNDEISSSSKSKQLPAALNKESVSMGPVRPPVSRAGGNTPSAVN